MNPAASIRTERDKHPERFCRKCLWRVVLTGTCPRFAPCPRPPDTARQSLDRIRALLSIARQAADPRAVASLLDLETAAHLAAVDEATPSRTTRLVRYRKAAP